MGGGVRNGGVWSLQGRTTRKGMWKLFALLLAYMAFVILLIAHFILSDATDRTVMLLAAYAGFGANLIAIPASVRRFHDLGMPGRMHAIFTLLQVVPVFGRAVGLVEVVLLLFVRGTPGPNAYGEDPLAETPVDEGNGEPAAFRQENETFLWVVCVLASAVIAASAMWGKPPPRPFLTESGGTDAGMVEKGK